MFWPDCRQTFSAIESRVTAAVNGSDDDDGDNGNNETVMSDCFDRRLAMTRTQSSKPSLASIRSLYSSLCRWSAALFPGFLDYYYHYDYRYYFQLFAGSEVFWGSWWDCACVVHWLFRLQVSHHSLCSAHAALEMSGSDYSDYTEDSEVSIDEEEIEKQG